MFDESDKIAEIENEYQIGEEIEETVNEGILESAENLNTEEINVEASNNHLIRENSEPHTFNVDYKRLSFLEKFYNEFHTKMQEYLKGLDNKKRFERILGIEYKNKGKFFLSEDQKEIYNCHQITLEVICNKRQKSIAKKGII